MATCKSAQLWQLVLQEDRFFEGVPLKEVLEWLVSQVAEHGFCLGDVEDGESLVTLQPVMFETFGRLFDQISLCFEYRWGVDDHGKVVFTKKRRNEFPQDGDGCGLCGGTIENIAAIGYENLFVCDGCGEQWWYD